MRGDHHVTVILPALNEELAIGGVIASIPVWVDDVIVVDNGSTDSTAHIAAAHGARVASEGQRGYGAACLRGIASAGPTDIIVFMDADASDDPHDMASIVEPIVDGRADMCIGSRNHGFAEPGALTPQARFGNWLACGLMRLVWGGVFTDLGPFRAIRTRELRLLRMQDRGYGWTVEMQVKALKYGLRCVEVPVSYRRRIGQSKISGTVRGVIGAGSKILFTIARHAVSPRA